jgi:DNA repair protein RecO (recombination protein O)
MNRDRLYRTEAIILKRNNLGEADRLLTLYTPYRGKYRVIAKGVRKPTSRKAGHLEILCHSKLLLARGRSMDIVTQAETVNSFPNLRADLTKTSRAYYIVELIDRFTGEGIENYPLFELLLQVLGWFNAESDVEIITRFYELHLLGLVGYQPQLFHCVRCDETIRPGDNQFSVGEGGVVCPRCWQKFPELSVQPISVNALKVLRYLQQHTLEQSYHLPLNTEIHRELERLMLKYITYHLERNLKSIEFIRRVRQPVSSGPACSPADNSTAGEAL